MDYIPNGFFQTIKSIHKEIGEKWLEDFNDLKSYCEEKWGLQILQPYELSYNFVAPAIKNDGSFVVVKLVVPNGDGFIQEVEALTLYQGNGIVKLIDVEIEKGIMILEHISPGVKLYTLSNDEEATAIMAKIMRELWIEAPQNSRISTIFQREETFKRIRQKHKAGVGPITVKMLVEAEEIFSKLTNSIKKLYLLHGDLHHHNVLYSNNPNKWVAIDPKGFIGEREYDVIQFLLNKVPTVKMSEIIGRRIDILVDHLELNRQRIILWGFCHSILSLYWDLEDFGETSDDTWKMVQLFEHLKEKI